MGHDFGSGNFVERYCSRCDQASWDNLSGNYEKTCSSDGRRCDTNGRTFVDGNER